MSRIRILPDVLSNKIAAGEVVERPSSVVKELVENSLDAGSTRIMIEVEKGGKSLIRISDNGWGMSHDDALLAIERFATSKIRNDGDLFNISTLGFRGEAIPSIASVSRFTLVTRRADADAGFSVRIDGGKLIKAAETGAPKGTMIAAGQLFFNTPARRKFLKTVNTEMGHIADVVSSIAMAHPSVQFRLMHNGKSVKNLSSASGFLERITDVVGPSSENHFFPVDFENSAAALSGAVAAPTVTRSTSRNIYIYVNGRFIKDRIIQHAIFEGYRGRIMKGQFPVAVLFLTIPPENVDVNVHPTKHEVRFVEQKRVHDAARTAVEEALKRLDRPKAWSSEKTAGQENSGVLESPDAFSQPDPEKKPPHHTPPAPVLRPAEEKPPSSSFVRAPKTENTEVSKGTENEGKKTADRESPPAQQSFWRKSPFSGMKVIGQCHNTYIVLESTDSVIMLDQHAAHERVLYEILKKRASSSPPESQRLLVPETFDLNFAEADLLEKLLPQLEEIGLAVEPFGGNTFVVKAVPVFLEGKEVQPVIREIVEKSLEIGVNNNLGKAMDESFKLMACHGAIRAGQKLSDMQIKELLMQLDDCETPSNCPHGRPTWIRWDLKALEKSFHRIV